MNPSSERPLLLSSSILQEPCLCCSLCDGYIIEATVVSECGHTFCRRCIINHLKRNKKCPKCPETITTLKSDKQLDALIQMLVPNITENERRREIDFYRAHSLLQPAASVTNMTTEQRTLRTDADSNVIAELNCVSSNEQLYNSFVSCPGNATIRQLKKAIAVQLAPDDVDEQDRMKIEILYKKTTLADDLTMMALLVHYFKYIISPMQLNYTVKKN